MFKKLSKMFAVATLCLSLGAMNAKADYSGGCGAESAIIISGTGESYAWISQDGSEERGYTWVLDERYDMPEGITFDAETGTITMNNAHISDLWFQDIGGNVTINLIGDNIVDDYMSVSGVTFTGTGNLTINGINTGQYIDGTPVEALRFGTACLENENQKLKFEMTGTITSKKGMIVSTSKDESLENYFPVEYQKKLSGTLRLDAERSTDERDIYYVANQDMNASQYANEVVVINNKVETETLEAEGIAFTSKDKMDASYKITLSDLLKNTAEEVLNKIKNSIKNSNLVRFYDISVVNQNEQIVEMKNGEYTIRLDLTEDEIKAYDAFKVVYVKDGEVKETFDAKVVENAVEFKTTHLSEYAVLGVKNSSGEPNPVTGDNGFMLITLVGIGLIGTIVAGKTIKKRLYN